MAGVGPGGGGGGGGLGVRVNSGKELEWKGGGVNWVGLSSARAWPAYGYGMLNGIRVGLEWTGMGPWRRPGVVADI